MDRSVQAKLSLVVTRFVPALVERQFTVTDLQQLRGLLAAVADEERLALAVDIDSGKAGMLLVHVTGDRAWVTHFESDQGGDTYAFDPAHSGGPVDGIGFLLSNGQEDIVHQRWTVSRREALQALEFFAVSGQRSPALVWDEAI
jgi:hypothetical protein